jgi:hypothetical protein
MKLYVENSVEQSLLAKELESSGIPAHFVTAESEVLGMWSKSGGAFGYFEVEAKDQKLAKEILDNIRDTVVEDTISKTKRNMVVTGPRILVSLLVLAQFAVIGYFVYENGRLEKQARYAENVSDFTRKWNSSGTILSRYYKSTGTLEAEFFDVNFNHKWEQEKFYDKKGRLRSWDVSSKDDGVFDNLSYYDTKGNLVQKYHNSTITERNDVFDIIADKNTYYEFTEVPDGDVFYRVKKMTGAPQATEADD